MRQLPGTGTAPGMPLLITGKKSNQICNQLFIYPGFSLWISKADRIENTS
jgi:hypothetical protein